MRHVFTIASKKINAVSLPVITKQRLAALFLIVVFTISMIIPPISAIATRKPQEEIKKRALSVADRHRKVPVKDPNTPMKQNYPGALQTSISDEESAVGAKSITKGLGAEFFSKAAPIGQALRGLVKKPKIQPHELVDRRTAMSSVEVNADGTLSEKHYFAQSTS